MLLLLFILFAVPAFSQADIIADYKGGEELILLSRNPINPKDYKGADLQAYSTNINLFSIYWNPSNNKYYYAKDGSRLTKTNNISYKIDTNKTEKTLAGISLDKELIYVGYISPTKRLYVDKNNNQQFIKTLEPINDIQIFIPNISEYQGKYYIEYIDSNGCSDCVYRLPKDGTIQSLAGM